MIVNENLKNHYPSINISIEIFVDLLNSTLIIPFKNPDKLTEFYNDYIINQYEHTLVSIEQNGYDKVDEWCEWYFKDWDFDKHSTILKSKFKSKYNNVKPTFNKII